MEMEPSATLVIPELNRCQQMNQASRKRSSWMGCQMFVLLLREGLEWGIFLSGGIYGCWRNWLTFHAVLQAVRRPLDQRVIYSMISLGSERRCTSQSCLLVPHVFLSRVQHPQQTDKFIYVHFSFRRFLDGTWLLSLSVAPMSGGRKGATLENREHSSQQWPGFPYLQVDENHDNNWPLWTLQMC